MDESELAAALVAWFVVVVALGASRVLAYDRALGVRGLGVAVMLPILVMTMLAFGTSGGRQALARAWVPALIGVNVVRVLGVEFLLLHAAGRLPAPFAPAAGWGDFVVGAAAPLVAWMVARDWRGSRGVALAWTALGLLDLVDAIGLGVMSSPGPLRVFVGDPSSAIMSEIPWILIPCFVVPLLAFTHLAVFARLGGCGGACAPSPGLSPARAGERGRLLQVLVRCDGEGEEAGDGPSAVRLAFEDVHSGFRGYVLVGSFSGGERPEQADDGDIA